MKTELFESYQIEFKKEIPKNQQILKTVVAFANGDGGRIYIGIDDDRNIVGVDETAAETMLEYLEKSIYEACSPPLFVAVMTSRYGEKLVVILDVSRGNQPPYWITALGREEGVFVRVGRNTVKAGLETVMELQWRSRGISYDGIPEYQVDMDEIDYSKVLRFLKERKMAFTGRQISDDILTSYRLAEKYQGKLFPTKGGLLLFGKNPGRYFPEQMVVCTQFSDFAARKVLATLDCEGDLFSQLDQAWNFVTKSIPSSFTIDGLKRTDLPQIPIEALRESIVNAIIHRSYAIHAPTKIAIFNDKIEVFSPGRFPRPIPVSELESGISNIRNSVISKCFRERGLAEKLGTGFITIFRAYREYGLERPKVIEGSDYVKVVLPRELQQFHKIDHSGERSILDLFQRHKSITTALVVKEANMSRATAVRKLGKLVADGSIIKFGEGAKTAYRMSGRK